MVKFTEDVEPPPLEPPEGIKTAFVPLKFWIVVSIMLVLYALAVIFSVYAVNSVRAWLEWFHGLLPKPPPQGVGDWETLTKTSLNDMGEFVASQVPELAWLP